jgi:hypothetical protein
MPADVRPPYDAELQAALAVLGDQLLPTITPDMITVMRAMPVPPIEELLKGRNINHREMTAPGH